MSNSHQPSAGSLYMELNLLKNEPSIQIIR